MLRFLIKENLNFKSRIVSLDSALSEQQVQSKAGFPLANFLARSDFFFLSQPNQFYLVSDESSKAKGQSRFARKYLLVENRLN